MSDLKSTNPKKQYGMAKPSACFIPPSAIVHLSLAMGEGAGKYGFFNWRDTDVDVTTYYSAAMRHWMLFFSGEDHDPKTGVHHLAYAMACASIIVDAQEGGTLADDRPKRTVDLGALIDALTTPISNPVDQSWADAKNDAPEDPAPTIPDIFNDFILQTCGCPRCTERRREEALQAKAHVDAYRKAARK